MISHCRGSAINFRREKIEEEDIRRGMEAYSRDLLLDADQELSDMLPEAEGFIYFLEREPAILTQRDLAVLMKQAGLSEKFQEQIVDFFLYYGFLGVSIEGDEPEYIYDLGYNMTRMKVLIAKNGPAVRYRLNPAFWPGLKIDHGGI
jgi:hypothetical protein